VERLIEEPKFEAGISVEIDREYTSVLTGYGLTLGRNGKDECFPLLGPDGRAVIFL